MARIPHALRSAHLAWACLILVPFAAWLAWLAQTELPEGQCSGIGWGCSVAGWDAVGLTVIFYGPLVLIALVVGHLVIAVATAWRRRTARTSRSDQS